MNEKTVHMGRMLKSSILPLLVLRECEIGLNGGLAYMDRRLYIRADANHVLGIGHVMRCKTIAEEWIERGGECVFLAADEESVSIIKDMGFSVLCLNGRWDNLEIEITALLEIIQEQKISCILIDSYYITHAYMKKLTDYVKVIYLGLMNEEAYPVHMLINYNITADKEAYEKKYSPEVKKLLGCRYFPLRQEFVGVNIEIKDEVRDIFLSTGGSDPYHVALIIAKELLARTDKKLHVILGAFNKDKEELKMLHKENPRLFLYENVQNMAEVISLCDIAVSAGGVTLYELSACGIPTVTYAFADNQLEAVHTFEQKGIMKSVGDIRRQPTEEWTEAVYRQVEQLCRNKEQRQDMSFKMKQLVDGKGKAKIVDKICEYMQYI